MLVVHQTDTIAPTSLISFTLYEIPDIIIKPTVFTITANDGLGSGVSLIRYKMNNSNWITYTGSFNLSIYEFGDYLITYQAIDVIGNVEIENTIMITLVGEEEEHSRSGIPGYNTVLFIGAISVITVILIAKSKQK